MKTQFIQSPLFNLLANGDHELPPYQERFSTQAGLLTSSALGYFLSGRYGIMAYLNLLWRESDEILRHLAQFVSRRRPLDHLSAF
ncbi:MAG: hypothetical protein E6J89_13715 [Deltaproteobacteria bacterium]|nr:MAG: hypothetical protein E6J89_13715 [Deltaproteobacteria bacterium]